jgi:hypothetical protein
MKCKINKNSLRRISLVTIITEIIAAGIYDIIKSKPFFTTIIQLTRSLINFITSFLNIYLQIWWVLVAILLLYIFRLIIIKYKINAPKENLEFLDYKMDRFKNWVWKWDWNWDRITNKWSIRNLIPYCPTCDIELLNRSNITESVAVCPKCKNTFRGMENKIDDSEGVLYIILDKVKKRNYFK